LISGDARDEDGTGRDHMERSAAREGRIQEKLAFAASPAGQLKGAERQVACLTLLRDDHGFANNAEIAAAQAIVTALRAKMRIDKI